MSADWTEKYRPKSLSDIIGNPSAVSELLSWARSWDNGIPKKRAAVLIGSPGVGKTSSSEALANDMKWSIIEMNASDQRTGNAIKEVALAGAYFNAFRDDGVYLDSKDGGRKLIVLDEADNLFGNADRGALPAINELIKTTKQPVVLIVNDFYALSKKSSAIKSDTLQISFRKPTSNSITAALRKIAEKEGITVSPDVLKHISEVSGGDMRAAVRDLEALSQGRTMIDRSSAEQLSGRVTRDDMYAVLNGIFRKNDAFHARKILTNADVDPDTALIWIDENLPYEYKEPGDLVRGYEKLSRSDVFLGRVRRRQYYGFWSYANDMMTAGVASVKMGSSVSHERFRFPQYLMKMSRSKAIRGIRDSVCLKLACFLHTSTKRVEFDILTPLREMALNDVEIRIMLVREVMFEPEELGFLLNSKIDSDIVKDAFLLSKETTEKNAAPPLIVEKPERMTVDTHAEKKPQSKLFDF